MAHHSNHTQPNKLAHKQDFYAEKKPFLAEFLLPKYWGIWLAFAIFLPLVFLPLRMQFAIGKALGVLLHNVAGSRRKATLVNLALAFPEKSDTERQHMAKQVFINQGIGVFETLNAWLRPNVFCKCDVTVNGLEHIKAAQDQGKAVILLGMHYTTLDTGGLLFTQHFPVSAVYRPQNNLLLEWFIYNCRRRLYEHQIHHRKIKDLDKYISQKKIIWYATDQDYGLRRGVMADFFGVPAATVTAGRYLATLGDQSNPPVFIGLNTRRLDKAAHGSQKKRSKPHYELTFLPPLENYPSSDEVADATYVNKVIEDVIRIEPTQWMWFHKRYKTGENGRTDYYK